MKDWRFWRGILGGFLGILLGLAANHLYTDHQALHTIINLINQNAAKQQTNGAAPTAP